MGEVHLVSYMNFYRNDPYLLKTFSNNEFPVIELDEYSKDVRSCPCKARYAEG